MKIILGILVAIVGGISGVGAGMLYQTFHTPDTIQNLGATVNFVGTLPTTLAGSGITSSQNTILATSLTIPQSAYKLTMNDFGTIGYITLEPGVSSRQEFASFTGITQNTNGTALLTGVTRGLLPISPYTASTTYAFSHGGGTKLIVSNSPPFYNNFALQGNNATISGLWDYTQLPTSNLLATQTNQFVTQAYVIGTVLSGAATATESVTGISRLATQAQIASSTASTANTPLVIQAQYATDTPNTLTRTRRVLVSDLTGYLKQGWINLSQAFTFGSLTATSSFQVGQLGTSATTTNFGPIIGGNIVAQFLASTTLTGATSPQPVFLATSTNSLHLSSVTGTSTDFLGFALQNVLAGATSTVQLEGIVPGFTGLTKGAQYYVNATGTIGTTKTTGLFVGYAVSSTEILINRGPESSWQYIGSTGVFSTTTCNTTTCGGTATVPDLARFIVVNSTFANTAGCTGPSGSQARVSQTVFRTGATSILSPAGDCASGVLVINIPTITSSVSGGTLTITLTSATFGANWSNQNHNAYFYR